MAKAKPLRPVRVRVLGKNFEVGVEDGGELGAASHGHINNKDLKITLDSTWHLDQQRVTFLHELIHAVELIADDELEMSEAQVAVLANGLFAVLRENPQAVAWLLSDADA